MVCFELVVTSDFWDRPRGWPAGCRPVVFSAPLMMRNAGMLQVPVAFAAEVDRLLREHPAVVSAARVAGPPSREMVPPLRSAA